MTEKLKNYESIIDREKHQDAANSKLLRDEIRAKDKEIDILNERVSKMQDEKDDMTSSIERTKTHHME